MGETIESRFEAYCDELVKVPSHTDRSQPARRYLKGLMLSGSRKSVEPMAVRVCPEDVRSAHQSVEPSAGLCFVVRANTCASIRSVIL
jgi:SRSO17 transposase